MRYLVVVFFALWGGQVIAAPAYEYVNHTDEEKVAYKLALFHRQADGEPVLYIHGSSFPSALSIGWSFLDGVSWADDLNGAGFDVWGLDFAGYGKSDRPDYAALSDGFSRSKHASAQIHTAVQYILQRTGASSISLIAHSWGTIPAALYAEQRPKRVKKLVMFGPIITRGVTAQASPSNLPDFKYVTIEQQRTRFLAEVPDCFSPVLEEPDLRRWGQAYLDTDPTAISRHPFSVKVPNGPIKDALQTWAGHWLYEPTNIVSPTLLIRGAWDTASTADDVDRLFQRLGSEEKRIVTVLEATHLMHLEKGRHTLWQAVRSFLAP